MKSSCDKHTHKLNSLQRILKTRYGTNKHAVCCFIHERLGMRCCDRVNARAEVTHTNTVTDAALIWKHLSATQDIKKTISVQLQQQHYQQQHHQQQPQPHINIYGMYFRHVHAPPSKYSKPHPPKHTHDRSEETWATPTSRPYEQVTWQATNEGKGTAPRLPGHDFDSRSHCF